jgi:SAM-dependent methyltransferase
VADPASSAEDLFAGTAEHYARYRPAYPPELIHHLIEQAAAAGHARALDLGCGTGELTLPLSATFDEVVAVDASAEMVAQGRSKAERAGHHNIVWSVQTAESYDPGDRRFGLITAGAAFHWMDRNLVASRAAASLQPGGVLAIAGVNSTWNGDELWQKKAVEVIQRWLGPRRRAGSGKFAVSGGRHEDVLRATGFPSVTETTFIAEHNWTLDDFIGYLYSTSFAAKSVLGERAPGFEADLRATLLALEPSGQFSEKLRFHVIVCGGRR